MTTAGPGGLRHTDLSDTNSDAYKELNKHFPTTGDLSDAESNAYTELVKKFPLKANRVVLGADASPLAPNADTTDVVNVPALSQTTVISPPTGTPVDGQRLAFRIKTAASQTLTWDAIYRSATTAPVKPASSTGSAKTDYVEYRYNLADTKWDVMFVSLGH